MRTWRRSAATAEVDETAIAKALAMDYPDDELMWNLPSMIEGDPQPTWPGIDKSKNNATKFSGIPIGFRSYSFNPADGGVPVGSCVVQRRLVVVDPGSDGRRLLCRGAHVVGQPAFRNGLELHRGRGPYGSLLAGLT